MASRKVSWEEWLEHGIYPADSPGEDAGKPFNPSDPNLRSYYDNYSSVWDAAGEAHRIAVNSQHGFGFANSGGGEGGEGGEGGGGGGGTAPSTGPVFTPLDLSAPGQNDYWDYYPQAYTAPDPAYPTMGLLSQPYSGGVDLYQPWSQQYGDALVADNLWNYNPPSLPGPSVGYFNANPFHLGGETVIDPITGKERPMTEQEKIESGLYDGTGGEGTGHGGGSGGGRGGATAGGDESP